jgi:hypothetical protein
MATTMATWTVWWQEFPAGCRARYRRHLDRAAALGLVALVRAAGFAAMTTLEG